jgi:hypothetical protein
MGETRVAMQNRDSVTDRLEDGVENAVSRCGESTDITSWESADVRRVAESREDQGL